MRSHHCFLIQTLTFLLFALLAVNIASAQARSKSEAASQTDTSTRPLNISGEQAKESIQWLATEASKHFPRTISGDQNWGDTKRVWAGVRMRMDGFKLRTHRRFLELKQGRWIKYDVTLPKIPPTIKITAVRRITDGSTGQQSWVITSSVASPMLFTARVQRWNLGVKLFSMTVSGKARLRLNSTLSVRFHANYGEIPPGLMIAPSVQKAELVMEHFEVDRISKIGGEVAEQWGELMEDILVERLVKRQNDNLVSKINQAIERERDDLKISLAEWFESWASGNPTDNTPTSQAPVTSQSPPKTQTPTN